MGLVRSGTKAKVQKVQAQQQQEEIISGFVRSGTNVKSITVTAPTNPAPKPQPKTAPQPKPQRPLDTPNTYDDAPATEPLHRTEPTMRVTNITTTPAPKQAPKTQTKDSYWSFYEKPTTYTFKPATTKTVQKPDMKTDFRPMPKPKPLPPKITPDLIQDENTKSSSNTTTYTPPIVFTPPKPKPSPPKIVPDLIQDEDTISEPHTTTYTPPFVYTPQKTKDDHVIIPKTIRDVSITPINWIGEIQDIPHLPKSKTSQTTDNSKTTVTHFPNYPRVITSSPSPALPPYWKLPRMKNVKGKGIKDLWRLKKHPVLSDKQVASQVIGVKGFGKVKAFGGKKKKWY